MTDIVFKGMAIAGGLAVLLGMATQFVALVNVGIVCVIPEVGRWWWRRRRAELDKQKAEDKEDPSSGVKRGLKKVSRMASHAVVPREVRWSIVPGEAGKELKGAGSAFTSLVSSLKQQKQEYRSERFEAAVDRLGLDQKALDGLRIAYMKKGRLLTGGAFVCVAVAVGALLGSRWLWTLSALLGAELLLLLGAVAFFRSCQIQQRRLFHFSEYIRRFYLADLNFLRWVE